MTTPTAYVADTHIMLWALSQSPRLSVVAKTALQQAEATQSPVYIFALSLVELRYLIEKGSFVEQDYQICMQALNDPAIVLTLAPLDMPIAQALASIPRAVVPDMPDRIVAATALALGLPLISADTKIRQLTNVPIVW